MLAAAGNLSALLYSGLFAVIMLLVAALGVAIRTQQRDLVRSIGTVRADGSPATEISYSRRQFSLLVALMTALTGACVIGAIHLFLGQGMSVASGLLAGFGLLGATFPVSALLGRIRRGALMLSEQGVWQRGWSFESSLTWADIAGVKAAFNGHAVILLIGYANAEWSPRYTTRLWRIDRLPPVPMIEVDCRRFDVDSHVLYDYLTCYAENADLRSELGTAAAIARAERSGAAP
ncbi:hypothetical protein H7J06_29705 [Mycobacterium hodleri]|uniref:hypothetical protein n=1 Tax=Mycolicibacterium hodleri TaxID=49897 RepID=UPI0021F3A926|nr:hypothetical protein [Mycolicibacterium hodleri]MCV7137144.1 hypothetical protein [Mycolicibacterium hodleri]